MEYNTKKFNRKESENTKDGQCLSWNLETKGQLGRYPKKNEIA